MRFNKKNVEQEKMDVKEEVLENKVEEKNEEEPKLYQAGEITEEV